jgi:threonine dehydratase
MHPIAQEAWASIHNIYAHVFETPLMPAPWLAELAEGSTVHLKCENRQATGSFKARGAAHKLFSMSVEELERGVVAASTGNHAVAVVSAAKAAAAQRRAAIPVSIYLPSTVSAATADRLRSLGAEVTLEGRDCVEAEHAARQHAQHTHATYVSPYNDPAVAGGQGSIAIELLMQLPRGCMDTGGCASMRAVHAGGLPQSVPARCLSQQWPALSPTPPMFALAQCLCLWAVVASSLASLLS